MKESEEQLMDPLLKMTLELFPPKKVAEMWFDKWFMIQQGIQRQSEIDEAVEGEVIDAEIQD